MCHEADGLEVQIARASGPYAAYLNQRLTDHRAACGQCPRPERRPRLVLDFDGVLHQQATGLPVPGAQEFCRQAVAAFEVWVISARSHVPGGPQGIERWLARHHFPVDDLIVSTDGVKHHARVFLDDHGLTFTGQWPSIDSLLAFTSWDER